VQSSCILNACSIINLITEVVTEDLKQSFLNRIEIFLGKTSSKKFKQVHQVQNLNLVKETVGFPSKRGGKTLGGIGFANACKNLKV
jgi:hypothetical protein